MIATAAASEQRHTAPPFAPAELLRPAAFPHPVGRLEVRETNISWIVLTGPYAYKIMKSVDLGFIDTSTLSKRRHLCEEELRLNRRFAPELYVDVLGITRGADGASVGGSGPVVEYTVRMKQFDASAELSQLLEHGTVSVKEIADLAVSMSEFHAGAAPATRGLDYPHTRQMQDAVLGNLAILLEHLDSQAQMPAIAALVDWTHRTLQDSMAHLRVREQLGFIRECHGDLHAGNVVRWRGRLTPFDCLEFDPRLRWIDVMSDVAFLVMDLLAHGRKDLAFAFLNAYLEHSGDYDGVRLLPFYVVYRALVRAMVDSIGAGRDMVRREEFHQRLRKRVNTAAAFIASSPPALFIMHGPSGSGKSSLSERLSPRLGAVRIRSDVERKRLARVQPPMPPGGGFEQGIYTPEFTHRTYARLLECAESCLNGGVNVIVDAAFLNGEERSLFRELAANRGIQFLIVSCHADRQVMARRVETRRHARIDPSDADPAVLDRQLRTMEPLSPVEQSHLVAVDTSLPSVYENTLAAIEDHQPHRRL
jgi:uncharacterized protein